jgi:hypothetical protein
MKIIEDLKLGSEIEIKTSDGNRVLGIFANIEKGYLSAVGHLGIIYSIPISSILNIVKF